MRRGSFRVQVGSAFLGQALGLALATAQTVVMARWLGPERVGVVALAMVAAGVLGLLLNAGIAASNVYFLGSGRYAVNVLARHSMTFALMAGLFALAIVGAISASGAAGALLPNVPISLLLMSALGIPMALLNSYLQAILMGMQRIVAVSTLQLLSAGVFLALTVAFIVIAHLDAMGVILASHGSVGASLVGACLLLRRDGAEFRPTWHGQTARTLLAYGIRGHFGNLFQLFNYRLDSFFVNAFLGTKAVGLYAMSVRFAELLWHLPNAVGSVIFPRAAASTPEEMNAFTPRVFRWTMVLTTMAGLMLAIGGRPVIDLFFTSAFLPSYGPMLLLLPGVILLGGAKVLSNEMAGRGLPHYNSINSALTLIVTVLLDLILIRRYGIAGASVASSAAYVVTFLVALEMFRRVRRRGTPSQAGVR